jgi:quercetin dioxygenase-like cupin family protein
MNHSIAIWRLCGTLLFITMPMTTAAAEAEVHTAAPQAILPQTAQWFHPPGNEAVSGAWLIGAESSAAPYQLRVRMQPDARIPPHQHPDTRNTTVLSGTLYVGFGDHFDPQHLVAIPAGGLYVAPAGQAHYLWARDGAVEYQESGVGPTGSAPASR